MSLRSTSALAVALLLALAGCSDGGDTGSAGPQATSQAESSPSETGPTYTAFDDLPGEELLYVEQGAAPVGLRMKAVDTVWQTELADEIADAGAHYLVVYVAVTGEADDRGVSDAWLNYFDFQIDFATVDSACAGTSVDAYGNCVPDAITKIEEVADGEWRDRNWGSADSPERVEMPTGATMISALAFQILDDAEVTGDLHLCARGRDAYPEDNCITIPAPSDPRG